MQKKLKKRNDLVLKREAIRVLSDVSLVIIAGASLVCGPPSESPTGCPACKEP